jgi:NADH:ubiquinone oxidoreductase subunit F (NADH-binding)
MPKVLKSEAGVPMQTEQHLSSIDSFYHLSGETIDGKVCQGMACFVARHLNQQRWQQASTQNPRVYCLGKCYAAPSSSSEDQQPTIRVDARQAIVLSQLIRGGAQTLDRYIQYGGYTALKKALTLSPDAIVQAIEVSDLRGRGGAGFPTGRKWRMVHTHPSPDKYVVANADEGDPGAYIDRFLIEHDPFCLLEALTIAGYAVGARKGTIYLRKEYPAACTVIRQAIIAAQSHALLGEHILGSDFSFSLEVIEGQGSYLCGEETSLIRSLEGKRPEAMPRPPHPTEHGLFGKPTLVNNVETLVNIPWIVQHGGEAFHSLGFSSSRGTKVVSLNSLFRHPGLYEIEFGSSVRHVVEDLGGGLKTGTLKGVIIGGPLAGIIPPALLDSPIGFEELHAIGACVGHGGIIAFDEHTSIPELIHHVFAFGAYESCGKCTPCRLGSRRIERIFEHLLENAAVCSVSERQEWFDIVAALAQTSLCGLGSGLAEFARSIQRYYAKELAPCFK